VEIGVKNDVGRLLINTQTSSQDEDISNTIPLDFDAKVQYYQTNKQSIIEDWLQNMRGFHFHLSSIVLAQIGIEDSWH
jgi:hypothetical protein